MSEKPIETRLRERIDINVWHDAGLIGVYEQTRDGIYWPQLTMLMHEASAEIERLRATLLHFGSMTASCLTTNTPEWMELLASELNKVCEVIGDADRWEFDGEGLRKAVPGA